MKKLTIILVAITVFLLGSTGLVAAQNNLTQTVAQSETINDDYYASGNAVNVAGTVNGDVYAATQNLDVAGTVNGDVYAFAQNVHISGKINGSLHLLAQSVDLNGATIGNSVQSASETFNANQSKIAGSLLMAGNILTLNSPVARNVKAAGSSVTINTRVGGAVNVASNNFVLGDQADIAGPIKYQSNTRAQINPNAKLPSGIVQVESKAKPANIGVTLAKITRALLIWSYLAALLVGILIVALLRKVLDSTHKTLQERFGSSFGWGALVLFLTLPVLLLLAITLVGLPLAFVLGVLIALAVYFGKFVVGYWVGGYILKRFNPKATPNAYVAMVIGLSLLYLVRIIPLVNFFSWLVVTCAGAGAVLLSTQAALRPNPAKARSAKKSARKK